jgi:hypothetical protein
MFDFERGENGSTFALCRVKLVVEPSNGGLMVLGLLLVVILVITALIRTRKYQD